MNEYNKCVYHQLKKLERFDWLMSSTFFLYFLIKAVQIKEIDSKW